MVITSYNDFEKHFKTCQNRCTFCVESDIKVAKLCYDKEFLEAKFYQNMSQLRQSHDKEIERLKSDIDRLQMENRKLLRNKDREEENWSRPNYNSIQQTPQINYLSENVKTYVINGTLWMKIFNIKEKINTARRGGNSVLVSESKYLFEPGYKFAIKIYLNGDGESSKKFLSAYFVICKGEYDDELDWPYTEKCSLSIFSNEKHVKNVVVNLKPDDNPQCYAKPMFANNLAAGSRNFVKLETIMETNYFIFDNSLSIAFKLV
jgi:hypothetical protein